uniref:Uncharacterized protein n=1 Tax=Rhizophora mucronata TaxID=61149 RepID=A0A2P2QTX0_RHIMU
MIHSLSKCSPLFCLIGVLIDQSRLSFLKFIRSLLCGSIMLVEFATLAPTNIVLAA